MAADHPNVALLKHLDLTDLDSCRSLFAEDFVWHFFNPKLPDIQGDYVGVSGLMEFFGKLGSRTRGSFRTHPQSAMSYGDELVVVHTINSLILEDESVSVHVIVVWRIVDGKIVEGWDIPSVYTIAEGFGDQAAGALA